jgi:hypothetical protein
VKKLVSIALLLSAASAFAGASQVEIRCKSSTGKTMIESVIPGDGDDAMVSFTVEGKSKTWLNGTLKVDLELNDVDVEARYPGYELGAIASIDEPGEKMVAIQVLEKTKYDSPVFTLIARPSTVSVRERSSGSRKGTFKAKVTGVDPREPDHGYIVDPITVSCTYDYSI